MGLFGGGGGLNLPTLVQRITVDPSGMTAGTAAASASLSKVGTGAAGVGSALTKGLTVPIIGFGVAAVASAVDVEDAQNKIVRATGATGKAAENLKASFKNVFADSAASSGEVATVLAELSQRTNLTGGSLENLTKTVLVFNRTIGKESPLDVRQLTSTLALFNIPAKNMESQLDRLNTVSQKTGVPLNDLLGTLQSAGPILKQFNLPIEQSAALLAQLDKAGVSSSAIMPGLRKAFISFAKEGKEPAKALKEVIDQMNALVKAGDLAGARQLAVKLFGARGAGLVDAAVSGKLKLDDLTKSLDSNGKSIRQIAADTPTLAGKMKVLQHNVELALAEFGTPILDAFTGVMKAILPVVQGVSAGLRLMPGPLKAIVIGSLAAIAAVGPLIKVFLFMQSGAGKLVTGLTKLPGLIGSIGTALGKFAGFVAANPMLIALLGLVVAAKFVLDHEAEIRKTAGETLIPPVDKSLKTINENGTKMAFAFQASKDKLAAVIADPHSSEQARQAAQAQLDKLQTTYVSGLQKITRANEDEAARFRKQSTTGGFIQSILGSLSDQAVERVKNTIDEIGKALGGGWNEVAGFAAKGIRNAFDAIKNFLKDRLENLKSLGRLAERIGGFIIDGLKKGVQKNLDFGNMIIDAVKKIPHEIMDFFGIASPSKLMDDIGTDIVLGLLNGLVDTFPKVLAFVATMPVKILASLGNLAVLLVSQGVGLIIGLFNGIVSTVPTVLSFIASIPGRILGALGNLAALLIGQGAALIGGLLGGIASQIGGLLGFVAGIGGRVIAAFGNIAGSLFSTGVNVIQGFWNGLISKAGSVLSWLGDFASRAWHKVTDFFRPGSPSKTAAETGSMIMAGLALGLTKGAPDAIDVMDQTAKAIAAAAKVPLGDVTLPEAHTLTLTPVLEPLPPIPAVTLPVTPDLSTASLRASQGVSVAGTTTLAPPAPAATDQPQTVTTTIVIESLVVRTDDDVRRIASDLDALARKRNRASGVFNPTEV